MNRHTRVCPLSREDVVAGSMECVDRKDTEQDSKNNKRQNTRHAECFSILWILCLNESH